MNKIALSMLACVATVGSISSHALQAPTLGPDTFFTNGDLTINISGACSAKVILQNVILHTTIDPTDYQDPFRTAIPVDAVYWQSNQEIRQPINYYGFVVADQQNNVIAAYAPARPWGAEIRSNGVHLQKFVQNVTSKQVKSNFQLNAAQDSAGAFDALFNYLDSNQATALKCKDLVQNARLDPVNESTSTFTLTDSSTDTYPNKYSYKTQFKAKTVASFTTVSEKETKSSFNVTMQAQPLTITVSFSGGGSGTYSDQ